MDSLTQIVLGAAVGEAVLGKKMGNKAMLYGAIAGTVPDLDVIAGNFVDTVTALQYHRGFSHSLLFSVLGGLLFGKLVSLYEKKATFSEWSLLFFAGFSTHALLDALTTWGTQLFWPLDYRFAAKTIFVIDPFYTLPFLLFLLLAMFSRKGSKRRQRFNQTGLLVSSAYLVIALVLKGLSYRQFKIALDEQQITYEALETRPTPFNTILWTANVKLNDTYLMGNYSFFDKDNIAFFEYDANHHYIDSLVAKPKMQEMIKISKDWFTITQDGAGDLYYNDLRFGTLNLPSKHEPQFVFSYKIEVRDGTVYFTEKEKKIRDGKRIVGELWQRIWGNE